MAATVGRLAAPVNGAAANTRSFDPPPSPGIPVAWIGALGRPPGTDLARSCNGDANLTRGSAWAATIGRRVAFPRSRLNVSPFQTGVASPMPDGFAWRLLIDIPITMPVWAGG